MAIGKVNVGGGGAGKLNIFTGLTEPKTKEGIWVRTDVKHATMVQDSLVYLANAWAPPNGMYTAPPVNFDHGGAVVVGDEIFYMSLSPGGQSPPRYHYKYNVKTRVWSQLPAFSMGAVFSFAKVAALGTKVYTFHTDSIYVFDTVANTWTTLAKTTDTGNTPYGVVAHDGYIYYLATTSGVLYRYNPADNKFTQLAKSPATGISTAEGVVIGGKIYWVLTNDKLYAYTIATDTWELKSSANPPALFGDTTDIRIIRAGSVAIGSMIYFMGGYNPSNNFYSYNTLTDVWTNIGKIISAVDGSRIPSVRDVSMSFVNNQLHVVVGLHHIVYNFMSKQYGADKTLILDLPDNKPFGNYYTELVTTKERAKFGLSRILSAFNNAWLYHDNDVKEYPTYYGDGTKWIKFKN